MCQSTRTLSLRRETLVELCSEELSLVQGAAGIAVMHTTIEDTCLTCQTSINGRCDS